MIVDSLFLLEKIYEGESLFFIGLQRDIIHFVKLSSERRKIIRAITRKAIDFIRMKQV
jgi:hypothetical protein